jgi:hypothetical protein
MSSRSIDVFRAEYVAGAIEVEEFERKVDIALGLADAPSLDDPFAHREAEEQRVSAEQEARNVMKRWIEQDITRTQLALQSQTTDDGS